MQGQYLLILILIADQSIEYGGEGKLFCQVSAYPVAETKWYHNDTIVSSSDEIQVDLETNALWIKNMTLNTYGEYKCELKNEVNEKTFTAFVNISGIGKFQFLFIIFDPNVSSILSYRTFVR